MVNDVLRTVLSVTIIMVILGSVLAGGVFDTTISTERDTVRISSPANGTMKVPVCVSYRSE